MQLGEAPTAQEARDHGTRGNSRAGTPGRQVQAQPVRHRGPDRVGRKRGAPTPAERAAAQKGRRARKDKLLAQAERLERFVAASEPKIGRSGKEVHSNVTDNDPAKMTTSHGVIQGYNDQALAAGKHQMVVQHQAVGLWQDPGHDGPDRGELRPAAG